MKINILGYGKNQQGNIIDITEESESDFRVYGLYKNGKTIIEFPYAYNVNFSSLENVLQVFNIKPLASLVFNVYGIRESLIQTMESKVNLSFCDSCGNEHKCKLYPLGGNGNLILCQKCFTRENNESRKDERGYTDPKKPFTSWFKSHWYNL